LGYRTIAQLLDAQSPSYFYKFVSGEKFVPTHKLELFFQLLHLNAAEARYFTILSIVSRPLVDEETKMSLLNRFRSKKHVTKTTTEI